MKTSERARDYPSENEERFEALLRDPGPCLTLLLGNRTSTRRNTRRLRWERMLREARRLGREQGLPDAVVDELVATVERALATPAAERPAGDGLAVLCSPRTSALLSVEGPVRESVRLGASFDVLPLLALRARRSFHVLALSRHRCRLVHWDGTRAVEVEVPGMPPAIELALGRDAPAELQYHSAGRHGQRAMHAGEPGDGRPGRVQTYLRRVEAAVHPVLAGAPVVLAGVESLLGQFRAQTRLPGVVAGGIRGNHDRTTAAELCARARHVLAAGAMADDEARLAQYHEVAARGALLRGCAAVARAAQRGQVEVAFFERPSTATALEEEVERAAAAVLRGGGNLCPMPEGGLEHATMAAILRPRPRRLTAAAAD